MTKATGKLARRRIRLSEFAFYIFHLTGIKHQAADGLSLLKAKGEDRNLLEDEGPVLTLFSELLNCALLAEKAEQEGVEEFKGLFVPFSPDICMMPGIMDSAKGECTDNI